MGVTFRELERYEGSVDEQHDARALVERAREGDERAWDTLYRGVYPRLLAYARRRLASPEEAKDAVSETMTRAVAKIDRFTWTGGGFDAWVFGILRHVVLDNQRASGRRTSVPLVDRASGDAGPLERILDHEEAEAVRIAFTRLDPADQELLELRVVGRLTSDEVAAVLGKRPGAVRTAQSRAVARLRSLMQEVADCAC
ncbi:MAG: polymerase sigma-70 factor, subfamily [Acidimicrobiaceae bacterium]|nr:polymerase sigma-70 factor, subfamily [Acidimicrobiaceae bacterium]